MGAIDISPNKKGGLMKEIIKEGVGEETPPPRSTVIVHYTAGLTDGTIFDSSRDRNEPFQFELDKGVIKAWSIGIATMKKGEMAILTCKPKYAFGKHGSLPAIPQKAALRFEVEIIDWKVEDLSPDKDGSIERYQIMQGKGLCTPEDRSLVHVHLTGMYNDKVFEARNVLFFLGAGEDCGVIEGVEVALEKFQAGEKSKLRIKSKYAFKNVGKPEFDIPPDATVEYIVELKNFEKPMPVWNFQDSEMIEQSNIYKEKGNIYFKANKYKLAIKMYKWMEFCLFDRDDSDADQAAEKANLLLLAHLNLALCYLKINRNVEAKDSCNEALRLSPQNEKALFRRGQAYLGMAYPEVAIKNFQEVLKVEPKNTAAAKQIEVCNNLIKKQLAKEKKLFANMFDKFAQEDKQKEEEKLREQPDVMCGALGEWGQEERPGGRDATAFERENPNILMLNANGTDEFQNM